MKFQVSQSRNRRAAARAAAARERIWGLLQGFPPFPSPLLVPSNLPSRPYAAPYAYMYRSALLDLVPVSCELAQ